MSIDHTPWQLATDETSACGGLHNHKASSKDGIQLIVVSSKLSQIVHVQSNKSCLNAQHMNTKDMRDIIGLYP